MNKDASVAHDPVTAAGAIAPASPGMSTRALLLIAVVALLAGLAGRVYLTSLAPRYAYKWDHFDNIQMGRAASEFGLLRVYGLAKEKLPTIQGQQYDQTEGAFVPVEKPAMREVNYPPLGVTLFWLHDTLLRTVAPGPVNTFGSRLVMSIASVLAEVLLAVVVFLLARRIASDRWALAAAVVCWLFPPLAMDSSFWGQTDAWFMAPAALSLYLMIRQRWLGAGICLAVTALLKPQGIFMGPVALLALILLPLEGRRPGIEDMGRRAGKMFGGGLAALVVLSLPWTIAGGLGWLDNAYLANFGMYHETTLKAFNIWYLDALRLDTAGAATALNATDTIAGITKNAWGRLLAIASLVLLAIYTFKRLRDKPELALVVFTGLWLWSTFMLPTQVHERYIVYCMPLLIVAATALRKLWPAVLVLAIVGAAELSHNNWLPLPPGAYPAMVSQGQEFRQQAGQFLAAVPPSDPRVPQVKARLAALPAQLAEFKDEHDRARPWEWLLSIACVLAYGWAVVTTYRRPKTAPTPEPPKSHGKPDRKRNR